MKKVIVAMVLLLGMSGCGNGSSQSALKVNPTSTSSPSTTASTEVASTVAPTTTTTILHIQAPRASRSASISGGDVWAALANCETHMQNEIGHGTDGHGHALTFYGYFQFTLGTWQSLGYSGNPMDYPYETQREAAQRLVARSGWGQFPVCGRRVS